MKFIESGESWFKVVPVSGFTAKLTAVEITRLVVDGTEILIDTESKQAYVVLSKDISCFDSVFTEYTTYESSRYTC